MNNLQNCVLNNFRVAQPIFFGSILPHTQSHEFAPCLKLSRPIIFIFEDAETRAGNNVNNIDLQVYVNLSAPVVTAMPSNPGLLPRTGTYS